jgi:predicted RNA-binding protein associated with RNAse of E/G family
MSCVRVVFSKWGGRAHWEYDAFRLGEDEHGTWLGAPTRTRMVRPGADYQSECAFAVLLPADGSYLVTFYDHEHSARTGWVEIYVDVTTPPVWDGDTLRLVDLDLDVVKGRSGRVWVDDEDEFADHKVRFGYPNQVVRDAVRTCEQVQSAVETGAAPYDGGTARRWLGRLEQAMMKA